MGPDAPPSEHPPRRGSLSAVSTVWASRSSRAAWQARPVRMRAGDMRAAWVSAVLMLPQAVAFAVIAGLPPEMGIYASVLPVIVSALLGASPRLLSGPNTAVSVMIGAALLPLATPGSADYLGLAATLTVLVALLQVAGALCGAGGLIALLPPFVYNGLTAGIGMVMVASQIAPASGLLPLAGAAPWASAWAAVLSLADCNLAAVVVAVSAVVCGHLAQRHPVRGLPSLVAAMLGGTLVAWLIDLMIGPAVANIDRIGRLHVALLSLSLPSLDWDGWYVFKQLASSAAAIALVGGLQTIVIARPTCGHQGRFNPRRELLAQGAANLSAAFSGGFAGSGSFNRTAAHVKAGAETPLAAVAASVLLLLLAWLAGPLFAYVAVPAVAGTIVLVGWGMARSGVAAMMADAGFTRMASWLSVAAAWVFGMEAALALITLLGFLGLVLASGRAPAAVPTPEERR